MAPTGLGACLAPSVAHSQHLAGGREVLPSVAEVGSVALRWDVLPSVVVEGEPDDGSLHSLM